MTLNNCDSLKNVDLGASALTGISINSESLESIEIPATVDELAWHNFYGCKSLKSVKFHEGLEYIRTRVFGDTALKEVWPPASLKYLGIDAFDPDVVIHFTGDAGKLYYTWFDGNGTQHDDPVVEQLLKKGFKIAQYRGTGLNNIDTYFKSAESAGYTAANTDYVSSAVKSTSIVPSDEASANQASFSPDTTENVTSAPASSVSDAVIDHQDSDSIRGADTVYEVVRKVVEDNPAEVLIVVLICILIAAFAGLRRYKINEK